MFRKEPEVLAATLRDSGAEPNGVVALYSVLTTFALFFCGPSSPSVQSSAAEVFPSAACLRGRPLGLPVGAFVLRRTLEFDLEAGAAAAAAASVGCIAAGDGAFSAGVLALGAGEGAFGGMFID